MAEGPTQSLHFPVGEKSTEFFRMGGYCPVSLDGGQAGTAVQIDTLHVPFNCYVRRVEYSYLKTGTNDLDKVKLASSGSAAKTIVAEADMTTALAAVAQDLHADVAGDAYALKTGDKIALTVTTDDDEAGYIFVTIHLRPLYAGPTL